VSLPALKRLHRSNTSNNKIGEEDSIPQTVRDVLNSRIDRLPASAQMTLKIGTSLVYNSLTILSCVYIYVWYYKLCLTYLPTLYMTASAFCHNFMKAMLLAVYPLDITKEELSENLHVLVREKLLEKHNKTFCFKDIMCKKVLLFH